MRFSVLHCAIVGFCLTFFPSAARADNFYHPLPTAKSYVDFDSRGFLINGQRTWISSAGIEYARVPRALWRDRLLKIKRAGFNCVEIYAFWNYHEIAPGKWDFTGDKDVGAFLDLVHELGLYATVRAGPYVCAEWEDGGFPLWLRFIPGLRVRQNEQQYLAAVDSWYNHLLPIVAAHQISRGGSVIMVQLENEDDEGWGAWNLDPVKQAYFKNLLDNARANGIDVLTFFSGMNHGGDPAPKEPNDTAKQPNPWYCTEFWCNWYSRYGAMAPVELTHFDRATWRFLQNGAQGFNVYMFHGGSNFGTTNNNEDAASYDYGAAIGQAGDLRPIYYKFKRIAYFARSFQDILEDANIAPTPPADNYPGLTVTTRSGPAGTLVFLDNPGTTPVDAKFADGGTMTLAPGEITGLVRDFDLGGNLKLTSSEARILTVEREGNHVFIVIYGPAGSTGRLSLSGIGPFHYGGSAPGSGWSFPRDGNSSLQVQFPASGVAMADFQAGDRAVTALAMSSDLADKSFLIDVAKNRYLVSGAPYVGDLTPTSWEKLKEGHFTMELPLDAKEIPQVAVDPVDLAVIDASISLGKNPTMTMDGTMGETFPAKPLPPLNPVAPTLIDWSYASADAEAAPNFDDASWKKSAAPLPMGANGDESAFAWYRTTIKAATAGTQYLDVPYIGDQALVFLNGQRVPGKFPGQAVSIPLDLHAGVNSLAILVSHNGRNKMCGTYGSIEKLDMKGLVGPVRLLPAAATVVPLGDFLARDWWKDAPAPDSLADPKLDTSDPKKWSPGNFHANFGSQAPCAWRSPFVCIRATLPDFAGPNRTLHVGLFDEKATFYLNGQKIGSAHNDNWNSAVPNAYTPAPAPPAPDDSPLVNGPLDLALDAAWKESGLNQLTIVLENSHAQATVGLLALTNGGFGAEVAGWKMRGGVTVNGAGWKAADAGWQEVPASTSANWQPLPAEPVAARTGFEPPRDRAIASGVPTFYRTTFTIPTDYYKDATPILRLSSKDMSRGFAWLNGHNLGRYPEKIAVDGLYLPECWLKPGANKLVILDEEGNAIAPEHLYVETAASRRIVKH